MPYLRHVRLIALLGFGGASACGGSEFSPGAGGSAGASGAGAGGLAGASGAAGAAGAGAGGTAGAGGASGSSPGGNGGGGNGGSGGNAGSATGGAGGVAGSHTGGTGGGLPCPSCPDTQFCNPNTGSCELCADSPPLRFGPAEKLGAVSQPQREERFPRHSAAGWFTYQVQGADGSDVYATMDPMDNAGSNIHTETSGYIERPYYLDTVGSFDSMYDRPAPEDGRRIWGMDNVGIPVELNGINQGPNGSMLTGRDFSIAYGPGRVWWMSDRFAPPGSRSVELVTQLPGLVTATENVALNVANNCEAAADDFAPWANPEGTFLLFSAEERGPGCVLGTPGRHDLFYVSVKSEDGHPTGPATRIQLSEPDADEREASLSPDQCWLYYARGSGAERDLFRAPKR